MVISSYYVESIMFALNTLEGTIISGDLTPEATIVFEQHIERLKQLISDSKNKNNSNGKDNRTINKG